MLDLPALCRSQAVGTCLRDGSQSYIEGSKTFQRPVLTTEACSTCRNAPTRPSRTRPPCTLGGRLDRTVVLVGMMGSGKTSVGRRLAKVLGWPFQDADWAIEDAAGHVDQQYLRGDRRGRVPPARTPGDRPGDGRGAAARCWHSGGGSFVADETRALIKDRAISIWLDSDIDSLVRRTGKRNDRPLLANGDPRAILSRLLEERRATYQEADIIVDSGAGSLGDVVSRALDALEPFAREAPSS